MLSHSGSHRLFHVYTLPCNMCAHAVGHTCTLSATVPQVWLVEKFVRFFVVPKERDAFRRDEHDSVASGGESKTAKATDDASLLAIPSTSQRGCRVVCSYTQVHTQGAKCNVLPCQGWHSRSDTPPHTIMQEHIVVPMHSSVFRHRGKQRIHTLRGTQISLIRPT